MDWGAKIEGEGGPACIFLSIMTLQLGQWCSNLSSNKCNNVHVSFDHITQSLFIYIQVFVQSSCCALNWSTNLIKL